MTRTIKELSFIKGGEELPTETKYSKLDSCLLDPLEEVEEEPAILSAIVEEQTYKLFTAGNISVISGAPKSKKTFFISAVAAAAASNDENKLSINMFGSLPTGQEIVLYFDTEQSKHHAQKVNKRICKMAGNPNPENFYYYKLRGLSATECLDLIKAAADKFKGRIGLICVDGIADLLSEGINNEAEANKVILEFMKMTEELNIHICTILHTNKNNAATLTGWIGTQLLKKAETILLVEKDRERDNVSHVRPTQTRDVCFKSFAFEVDLDGIPHPTESRPNLVLKSEPHQALTTEEIHDILAECTRTPIGATDFKTALKAKLNALEGKKIKTGGKSISDFYIWLKKNQFIELSGNATSKEVKHTKLIQTKMLS